MSMSAADYVKKQLAEKKKKNPERYKKIGTEKPKPKVYKNK